MNEENKKNQFKELAPFVCMIFILFIETSLVEDCEDFLLCTLPTAIGAMIAVLLFCAPVWYALSAKKSELAIYFIGTWVITGIFRLVDAGFLY